MRGRLQKGSVMEPLLILVFLSIIIFVFIIPSHSRNPYSQGIFSNGQTTTSWSSSAPPERTSAYTGHITLGSGNAQSAIQSYEEYVTVDNNSNESVDITGWTLSNGKGLKTYAVDTSSQRFASDYATIPKGALIINPSGSVMNDIVLAPGEEAIVTTGNIPNSYPFAIPSFKDNECTSYLNDQNTYNYYFYSPPSYSCVSPLDEQGASGLDRQCREMLQSVQSCTSPKLNSVDYSGNTVGPNGETCFGCINGTAVSNACSTFVKSHLTYQACLNNHSSDKNFYGRVWHVYLGRGTEMWAEDHDVITLHDRSGKVVDYLTY